jgi:hypothetical protein
VVLECRSARAMCRMAGFSPDRFNDCKYKSVDMDGGSAAPFRPAQDGQLASLYGKSNMVPIISQMRSSKKEWLLL